MPRLLSITGLLVLLLLPLQMHALVSATDSCSQQIYDRMAAEERVYRSVLFGQKKSSQLPAGSVRFDIDGNSWMKTGSNQWRSLDEGFESTTWSDFLMDERADTKPRRGYFEMRQTPTSDLIPPLLQSMRALQCRLNAVCETARLSQGKEEVETINVKTDGCLGQDVQTFASCTIGNVTEAGTDSCALAVEAIIERESRLLEAVIAYDSAYRSLMQFAGIFEGFLSDVRFPLIEPIWQMVRAFGQLDNLPCFSGQCDE